MILAGLGLTEKGQMKPLPLIHRRRFTGCRSPSSVCVLRARRSISPVLTVLLTARAGCFLVGHHEALRESTRRLQAFAEAAADVLFAPGPHDPTAIKALVDAVRPRPINVLVLRDYGLSVADIAALGVRRISVGGALALAAWTGFTRAAQKLKSEGSFAGFEA